MPFTHKVSNDTRETIAQKPYVPQAKRGEVASADVLLVPYEGWGGHDGPLFAQGTIELANFLRDELPVNVEVVIPIEDDQYEEIALHGALLILGTIAATALVLPTIANLLAHFIIKKLERTSLRPGETDVRLSLLVFDGEHGVRFDFEGKPKEFATKIREAQHKEEMVKALTQLAEQHESLE